MSQKRLKLVLCWHMHQPWYREDLNGDYRLPWVYLHALKDYSDMAAHFEAHPNMRGVVNFTPVLLEQLEDYARQLDAWLSAGEPMSDPMLNLLAGVQPVPQDPAVRQRLFSDCLRAHAPTMIETHPAFVRLLAPLWHSPMKKPDFDLLPYMNDQYLLDVLTWYHLAWLGHSLRNHPAVTNLQQQERYFAESHRRELLGLMAEVIRGLSARYQALAQSGQIELSVTPYSHPIMPLLIDFDSMLCALPESPMPSYPTYPGGLERAQWQLQHGLEVFERFFGFRPRGVWLSEGSISEEAVKMLPDYGIRWTASGEGVWHGSSVLSGLEHNTPDSRRCLFAPHILPACDTRVLFRDDGLSDRIGFEYQGWRAEDAAGDFRQHLHNIHTFLGDDVDKHMVSVILDGENAWEYYTDNGFHFIGALYEQLARDPLIEVTTFDDAIAQCPALEMPKLCAGSWVYGSFSTWIGEPDKNRAWDRLVEAKNAYDEVMAEGRLGPEQQERACLQLAVCEGSDWFWWFGDHNPAESVRDFDQLYRQQLKNLYHMLERPLPANLDQPLSAGGGQAENAGTMRRGHE